MTPVLSKVTPDSPPTRPRRGGGLVQARRPQREMLLSDPAAGGDWIRNTALEKPCEGGFLWRPLAAKEKRLFSLPSVPGFRTGRFERKSPMKPTRVAAHSGFLGQQ